MSFAKSSSNLSIFSFSSATAVRTPGEKILWGRLGFRRRFPLVVSGVTGGCCGIDRGGKPDRQGADQGILRRTTPVDTRIPQLLMNLARKRLTAEPRGW